MFHDSESQKEQKEHATPTLIERIHLGGLLLLLVCVFIFTYYRVAKQKENYLAPLRPVAQKWASIPDLSEETPVKGPYVLRGLLFIDKDKGQLDENMQLEYLPKAMRPNGPDDVHTVIWLSRHTDRYGPYYKKGLLGPDRFSEPQYAERNSKDVMIIDIETHSIIGHRRIHDLEPGKTIREDSLSSGGASPLSKFIMDYIMQVGAAP